MRFPDSWPVGVRRIWLGFETLDMGTVPESADKDTKLPMPNPRNKARRLAYSGASPRRRCLAHGLRSDLDLDRTYRIFNRDRSSAHRSNP